MSFEEGQLVKLKQPVIRGKVTDTRYNKDAKELERLVSYKDADGNEHTRWFLDSDLEATK